MDTAAFLRRHFADLRPDELIEIRCIFEPKEAKPVVQRYFTDPDKAAAFALAGNAKGYHAYYGVNPRSKAAVESGATGREAVARAKHTWVDIDCDDDDDRRHAAHLALAKFSRTPDIIIDSGGGYQALWRLTDDDADWTKVERVNGDLATLLDGDPHVTDLPRVLRLPGTINLKPHYDPETTAQVTQCFHTLTPVDDFPRPEPTPTLADWVGTPGDGRYPDDTIDATEFYDALASIDPWAVDYDAWLRILMAIHAFDPSMDGLVHAVTWAQGKRGEVETKWRGFKKSGSNPSTVFHFAKEAGWTRPERPYGAFIFDQPEPAAPADTEAATSAAPRPKTMIHLTSLTDFFQEEDDGPRWLVDDLLNAGGTSLLVAKQKVGKSTFAANLAIAVGAGLPFLGHATQQGMVHIYSMEVHRSFVREQYKGLIVAHGLQELPDIRIHAGTGFAAKTFEQIATLVLRDRPKLVILDTLAKVVDTIKDGNDYLEVYKALRPVVALAEESGAHIVCVHHANKGMGEGSDAVMGSVGFAASVDLTMLLKRDREANLRTLELEARFLPESDPLAFDFTDDRRIVVLGDKANVLRDTAEARILAQIAATPGVTTADLKLYTGLPTEILGPTLHTLIQTFRADAEGPTKRQPLVAYTAPAPPPGYRQEEY